MNFWCSDYLPFAVRLLGNLVPSLASLEQFSQGYLRCCHPDLSPKNFHRIKHNSQLLGCDYFFKSTALLPFHFYISHNYHMWSEGFPAISINKDVTAISNSGPAMWISVLRKSNTEYPAAIRMWKNSGSTIIHSSWQELAPGSWDAYDRNDFNKPRLLPLMSASA